MLVSLPALLAAKLWAIALPASFLDQGLAIAGSPHTGLLKSRCSVIPGHVVQLVVNRAILYAAGTISNRELVGWEACGRRWEASYDRWPGETLGHGVPTRVDGDGKRHSHVARFLESGGERGYIGTRVRHALAAGDAVGAIEGTTEERVRVITRVGLPSKSQTGRYGC